MRYPPPDTAREIQDVQLCFYCITVNRTAVEFKTEITRVSGFCHECGRENHLAPLVKVSDIGLIN